jgi:hypothetical protein
VEAVFHFNKGHNCRADIGHFQSSTFFDYFYHGTVLTGKLSSIPLPSAALQALPLTVSLFLLHGFVPWCLLSSSNLHQHIFRANFPQMDIPYPEELHCQF